MAAASSINHASEIAAASARISTVARSGGLQTPIPHLGRWKVRDLVAHLGGVHEWANRILVTASQDGPGFRKSKLDGDELCDWFDEGATRLVETIAATPPDAPCPNFNPGSPSVSVWWFRRQLHETVVHRWDAEAAVDQTTKIDPVTAADGVDEFLDTFVRTRGKQTLVAPLVLTSTDPARSWTLRPAAKPGRLDIEQGAADDAAVAVRGDAASLLLVLWGRLPADGLETVGDAAVAQTYF